MAEVTRTREEKDVEMFQVNVPKELADKAHKFMKDNYLSKTTLILQALDYFLSSSTACKNK